MRSRGVRLAPWVAMGGLTVSAPADSLSHGEAFGCSIDHQRLYTFGAVEQVVVWRGRVARVAIHCVSSSRSAGSAAQKHSMMVVKPIKPSSRSLCVSMMIPWSGFGENEWHANGSQAKAPVQTGALRSEEIRALN